MWEEGSEGGLLKGFRPAEITVELQIFPLSREQSFILLWVRFQLLISKPLRSENVKIISAGQYFLNPFVFLTSEAFMTFHFAVSHPEINKLQTSKAQIL